MDNSLIDKNLLHEILEEKYRQYCTPDFLPQDPLGLVRTYQHPADREIFGLLIATISWGNRVSILKSGERLKTILGESPHDFVCNAKPRQIAKIQFIHRTFNALDLQFFVNRLGAHFQLNDSLEPLFVPRNGETLKEGIENFRSWMLKEQPDCRTSKHIASPLRNSSAKRLNMYLRWMVRTDAEGVDLGLWKSISPAQLMLPLDVHTGNVARKLNLLQRTANDWKALEELMRTLRAFDAKDPCKYDFALFGMGVSGEF